MGRAYDPARRARFAEDSGGEPGARFPICAAQRADTAVFAASSGNRRAGVRATATATLREIKLRAGQGLATGAGAYVSFASINPPNDLMNSCFRRNRRALVHRRFTGGFAWLP